MHPTLSPMKKLRLKGSETACHHVFVRGLFSSKSLAMLEWYTLPPWLRKGFVKRLLNMQVGNKQCLWEHFHLRLRPRGILQVVVILDLWGEGMPLLAVSVLACHSVVTVEGLILGSAWLDL
jgi:hypothetical protein